MKTVKLVRQPSKDYGTLGELSVDGKKWKTIELPWKDNKNNVSCIPAGTYKVTWQYSPKHGLCYELVDVPKRTDVQIHSANFAGDTDKGYKAELLGCIALGKTHDKINGQMGVTSSKISVKEFNDYMNKEPFLLEIING